MVIKSVFDTDEMIIGDKDGLKIMMQLRTGVCVVDDGGLFDGC